MKRFDWDRKYTTIAVYAFLVIAASILFGVLLLNFMPIKTYIGSVLSSLTPFAIGFVLAYLLNPLMVLAEKQLSRFKLSAKSRRKLALLVTYLVSAGVIALFLLVVLPTLTDNIKSIATNLSTYSNTVDSIMKAIQQFTALDTVPQEIADMINDFIAYLYNLLSDLLKYALSLTTKLTGGIITTVVGVIISIYMLSSKEQLFAQSKKLLYTLFKKERAEAVVALSHRANKKFSGFISGKIIDSFAVGVICLLGMYIFKMPFPELISIIVGVTNFIPYFGPFIGAIPGVLLVFLSGSYIQALGFALFILVLQQFDGNIMGPAILGQYTDLQPMWVVFAILLFGSLYGFVGMLIGVPLLSILFTLVHEAIDDRLRKKQMPTDLDDYASEKHKLF